MKYADVLQGVQERFGSAFPPADPEYEKQIQRNRENHPEAVAMLERLRTRQDTAVNENACPICGGLKLVDLGYQETDIGSYHFSGFCKCMELEKARKRIEKSGLSEIMKEYTFDSFQTRQPFQQEMARICAAYIRTYLDSVQYAKLPWLFIGGQSGCGKTHLCTAVFARLMSEGVPGIYISWLTECRKLKGLANDSQAYREAMQPLEETPILYIDDLFKSKDKTPPTDADVRIAFDIINSRYTRNKATIISSEWVINELVEQDQATGSRIKERSTGFALNIGQDSGKNYRL